MKYLLSISLFLLAALNEARATEGKFEYATPGELEQASGQGVRSEQVFFPTMQFPLEDGPAYLNSQVYRPGGSHSPSSEGQCAPVNYSYPWHDNFCEVRGYTTPLCPAGTGHQGQDIRPKTCQKNLHWAVAVEDGIIAHIGSYSVTLQTKQGTLFRYMHMNMKDLAVRRGDAVKAGARIGKVSNDFGNTSTTIHLHFEAKDSVKWPDGSVTNGFVPPYTSLISSYRRLMPGE
jgi:murein DD-endopeptidase MepM/ murein hydrolase activator NlpD